MDWALIGRAVGMFAVTNVDDMVVLAVFFGRAAGAGSAGPAPRSRRSLQTRLRDKQRALDSGPGRPVSSSSDRRETAPRTVILSCEPVHSPPVEPETILNGLQHNLVGSTRTATVARKGRLSYVITWAGLV